MQEAASAVEAAVRMVMSDSSSRSRVSVDILADARQLTTMKVFNFLMRDIPVADMHMFTVRVLRNVLATLHRGRGRYVSLDECFPAESVPGLQEFSDSDGVDMYLRVWWEHLSPAQFIVVREWVSGIRPARSVRYTTRCQARFLAAVARDQDRLPEWWECATPNARSSRYAELAAEHKVNTDRWLLRVIQSLDRVYQPRCLSQQRARYRGYRFEEIAS